jgi:hypothetical protein
MSDYAQIELDDGATILIEIPSDDADDGYLPAGAAGDAVRRLPDSFIAGLGRARNVAQTALRELRSGAEPPDRVAVEFGLKGVFKTGFVLAESAGEAHLKVVVEWQRRGAERDASEDDDAESDSAG